MGVVRFICGLLVHLRASSGSLDLSGVFGFTLVVLGLIRCRWAHFVRLIRGRWVHSYVPCVSMVSSCVVWFTQVRPWCRWVHPGKLRSLSCSQGDVGFDLGRWVRLGLLGSLASAMGLSGVVGITRARPGCR